MVTLEQVRHIALALPGVTEDGCKWMVGKHMFVWERPLRKSDLAALGLSTQPGTVLGVKTADLEAKEAILAEHPAAFVTPHFHGYPAVLVRLDDIDLIAIEELVTDAWMFRAPKRVVKEYLADRRP